MMTGELESFIRKELKRGEHLKKIRKDLIDLGYSVNAIEEAVNSIYRKKRTITYSIFGFLIIITAGVLLFLFSGGEDEMTYTKAVESMNVSNCRKLDEYQKDCITYIEAEKEKQEEDEESEKPSDDVLYMDAIRSGNKELCGRIENEQLRARCESRAE